ncbi:sigma-54 dependent transcriptional regulator [Geomonas paludis]|uniref:Sigma-54 dependent transcriptional regulator n=1 Tax=Geomonas paludis TaxID=2740185 RepID=A0A6V8MY35_9BACT|nr:sigma-54 dependent transcriptional regulator [Geomonas paludis]UPU34656.1 sigma-54 dependent transcriptional regulator [Geomonas paludis]GFO65031.1 sigma-54-dependent Fis family transcriptional regulator [Geomonas paludis]
MIDSLTPDFEILLVDDEEAWLRSISMTLAMSGGINNVVRCSDSRKVPELLRSRPIGLVLLDLNMPNLSGQDLLPAIIEEHPEVPVIVLSGLNQVSVAVECMQKGAFDFFVKTVEEERLIQGIHRAIRMIDLQRENREMKSRILSDRLENAEAFADILTADRAMLSIFRYIEAVAGSSQPILITGESGVGKELVARAVHKVSRRPGQLVSVNVAGLDDQIFSDTLFGHTRGAFTGAELPRSGMIERAADGTLFLDEIGDLAITSQVKLLRLLQEGEYFSLGSDVPKRMNARVVVATHHDLAAKQAAGEFRKDFYYRLCGHHIHIPALRERPDDIPLLFDHFLEEAARELKKKKPTVPKELPVLLTNYSFPGNVRELRALVYDAMSRHEAHMLSMETFKRVLGKDQNRPVRLNEQGERSVFVPSEPLPPLHEVADLLVAEAMRRAGGNQSIACRLIGVSQPALSKRLKKTGDSAP